MGISSLPDLLSGASIAKSPIKCSMREPIGEAIMCLSLSMEVGMYKSK